MPLSLQSLRDSFASERAGSLEFLGPESARLFTRELAESLVGVLTKNYRSPLQPLSPGFVSASVDGRPWTDTMWTRDAGVFLRELVHWGYFAHARLTASCLMDLVQPNPDGFLTFPMFFKLAEKASGDELDGTAAICISFVLLWQRLPDQDPMREELRTFLRRKDSPLAFIALRIRNGALIAGSGEFGGGCGIEGLYCNVVQNTLVRCALEAAASLEEECGDTSRARELRGQAESLERGILKHLVAADGSWIWCVDPATLKPDPAVVDHIINRGFGGLNGPGCMVADVLGMEPAVSGWPGAAAARATFDKLLANPMRRRQFDAYGLWTQFDDYGRGYLTGPSYGHGYALQGMLLYDRMDLVEKALGYLIESTFRPPRQFAMNRQSPYWFYERYHSPDDEGGPTWDEGCGALNLVCVAEPMKVARLVAGIDDVRGDPVLLPRLPASWEGYRVRDWPVRTSAGTRRIDVDAERRGGRMRMEVRVRDGAVLPRLTVKTGRPGARVSQELRRVSSAIVEIDA